MGLGDVVGKAVGGLAGGFMEGAGLTARAPNIREDKFRDPRLEENRRLLEGRIAGLDAGTPGSENRADVISRLSERVAGNAPSVAEQQLQRGTDRNIQQVAGRAASARGVDNPALVERMALESIGGAGQEAAGQAATLRAQEQAAAEEALSAAVARQEQAEIMREQLVQGYVNAGLSMDQAQFLANQELEKLRVGGESAAQGQNLQARGQVAGGLLGGGASVLGKVLSDEREKTGIEPGDEAIRAVLDKLEPYSFRYKDPGKSGATDGDVVGVMAQDLVRSEGGRDIVHERDDRLHLDPVKAISAALAASADLHHRVKGLESRGA